MWVFLVFLAIPLIEIALFLQAGAIIGTWWTLAIVVATALLGSFLVRSQGTAAITNLRHQAFLRMQSGFCYCAHRYANL